MHTALRISEAAGLAIHALTIIARQGARAPVKLARLADALSASESHLGKVMHRLAVAGAVHSKRGPGGGFTLGPKAERLTLLDVYELFDGPLGQENCLLGHARCPFGGCVLGDAVAVANDRLRSILSGRKLTELTELDESTES